MESELPSAPASLDPRRLFAWAMGLTISMAVTVFVLIWLVFHGDQPAWLFSGTLPFGIFAVMLALARYHRGPLWVLLAGLLVSSGIALWTYVRLAISQPMTTNLGGLGLAIAMVITQFLHYAIWLATGIIAWLTSAVTRRKAAHDRTFRLSSLVVLMTAVGVICGLIRTVAVGEGAFALSLRFFLHDVLSIIWFLVPALLGSFAGAAVIQFIPVSGWRANRERAGRSPFFVSFLAGNFVAAIVLFAIRLWTDNHDDYLFSDDKATLIIGIVVSALIAIVFGIGSVEMPDSSRRLLDYAERWIGIEGMVAGLLVLAVIFEIWIMTNQARDFSQSPW